MSGPWEMYGKSEQQESTVKPDAVGEGPWSMYQQEPQPITELEPDMIHESVQPVSEPQIGQDQTAPPPLQQQTMQQQPPSLETCPKPVSYTHLTLPTKA